MSPQKRNRDWEQSRFFLIIPKPLEDELLSSWLLRTSFAHMRTMTTFLSLFVKHDGSGLSRKDIDFAYNEKLFDTLAQKSTLDIKQIKKMSIRDEEGYLFVCNDCLYPPKQIRKLQDKRMHNGLMFCPKCLEEDEIPYWRKKWRYNFYNACPKHELFLSDRCWNCYERVRLNKMNSLTEIVFCNKCGYDLRKTLPAKVPKDYAYGLEAITCFENGLRDGYFMIGDKKISSLWIFEAHGTLQWLLDRKEKLILRNFPMLDDYKALCEKLKNYQSKKGASVYKNFFLNAMVYHLFKNYPINFKTFIKDNHLTHRYFKHFTKNMSFWYKEIINGLIPVQNKVGREISESEVLGAIKYLKSIGGKVTQESVAAIVGCHFTIHKQFVRIYKSNSIVTGQ